jgi:transketolase
MSEFKKNSSKDISEKGTRGFSAQKDLWGGMPLQAMANCVRFLTVDTVEQSQSGHPGCPLGMADVLTVLWSCFLKFNPQEPWWPDRDRFILSAGHGSLGLYTLLCLSGYDVSLDDLKKFRQLGSITPGHPEYGHTPGVEVTTGPLGQGLANGVGMALAECKLRDEFGSDLVDHHTYVVVGDGCLMEGISQEAITLAGHLKLGKLIVLYDDNGITIDGGTHLSTSDNAIERFKGAGWHAQEAQGHCISSIINSLEEAKKSPLPSLIAFKTTIGYGCPTKAGSEKIHGSPIGPQERKAMAEHLCWPHEPFVVPKDLLDFWHKISATNKQSYDQWNQRLGAKSLEEREKFLHRFSQVSQETNKKSYTFYPVQNPFFQPELQKVLESLKQGHLEKKPKKATRALSGDLLNTVMPYAPWLMGGSCDLSESNQTKTHHSQAFSATNPSGNYIHYGIREHAMAGAMNGLYLHGGLLPYGGTFLTFSDYCRPGIRLSALMEIPVIYVMTHDSIGLGEDGPTHQPIEHLAALRAIPNLNVLRPADSVEVVECWEIALQSKTTPSLLCLTRQAVPTLRTGQEPIPYIALDQCSSTYPTGTQSTKNLSSLGAYILAQSCLQESACSENASIPSVWIDIWATGSEVGIALDVHQALEAMNCETKKGFEVGDDDLKKKIFYSRVISAPCWRLFQQQHPDYRQTLMPNDGRLKVAIEAASSFGWERYIGNNGLIFAIDTFGASAPAEILYKHFGLNQENILEKICHFFHETGENTR